MRKLACFSLCLAGLLADPAYAQPAYDLASFTIDGGGGVSSGGSYSVSGSLGRPDAGKLIGGLYGLDGGFWAIAAAVQTTPSLAIRYTGTNTVILSWPAGSTAFVLHESATLGSTNWTTVTAPPTVVGGEYRVIAPAEAIKKFYRLQSQ